MKILLLLALFLFPLPTYAQVKLFPNDSLDDWYIVGPQIEFTVKDGVLTGEGTERRNSFLTSKKIYDDFYLKVELKIIRGNSGIQVRSHDVENRLVGYQIEVFSPIFFFISFSLKYSNKLSPILNPSISKSLISSALVKD